MIIENRLQFSSCKALQLTCISYKSNSLIHLMIGQPFVESYSIVCSVGDGTQGQAFLARRQDKNFVIKLYFPSIRSHEYYSKQVQILTHITSPFIIQMAQHFAQARAFLGTAEEIRPAIVLQFAEHGELFKLVNLQKFSQDVSRTLFVQLLKAIKHLKDLNITHRDIKLENILLDERFNLKLADFGFARDSLGNNHDFYLKSWKGTETYMAPEIHNKNYRGQKVDLFAAGVVLFLMFVRIPPFQNTEISNQKYNLIREGKFAKFWSLFQRKSKPFPSSFKNLIERLFTAAPEMRPTVEQVLEHEWAKGTILTNQQLYAYMQPRYERLTYRDEETRIIRRNLRDNLQRMANEHDRNHEQRQRSRERGERRQGTRGDNTLDSIQDILQCKINRQDLPQIKYYNISYAKVSLKTALLWTNQHLSSMKSSKTHFFKDQIDDIQLSNFELAFDHKGKIDLTLSLDITSEEDSVTTEIKLNGQIVQWHNQISIMWSGQNGNQFWLYQIIQNLNSQFQLTFA